jgi:hypothetical protein
MSLVIFLFSFVSCFDASSQEWEMKNEYNVNIAEISVTSELLQFEDAIELSEDSFLKDKLSESRFNILKEEVKDYVTMPEIISLEYGMKKLGSYYYDEYSYFEPKYLESMALFTYQKIQALVDKELYLNQQKINIESNSVSTVNEPILASSRDYLFIQKTQSNELKWDFDLNRYSFSYPNENIFPFNGFQLHDLSWGKFVWHDIDSNLLLDVSGIFMNIGPYYDLDSKVFILYDWTQSKVLSIRIFPFLNYYSAMEKGIGAIDANLKYYMFLDLGDVSIEEPNRYHPSIDNGHILIFDAPEDKLYEIKHPIFSEVGSGEKLIKNQYILDEEGNIWYQLITDKAYHIYSITPYWESSEKTVRYNSEFSVFRSDITD